jgi:hypothetical protein
MEYYPWLADDEDDSFAWIDDTPKELMGKEYLLKKGVPVLDWFPSGVVYEVAKEYGTKLTDSIPNTLRMLFVSQRLKELLEERARDNVIEFLPVRLKNRKKLVDKQYYIANVLSSIECMDRKKSDFKMNPILKDQVSRFRRLALDEKKIPKNTKLFRLAERTSLILVRQDLAHAILDADMSGMMFIPLASYGAEFRPRS